MEDLIKKVFDILTELEIQSTITLEETVPYSIEVATLIPNIIDIEHRLAVVLKNGTVSPYLKQQLAIHQQGIGERFHNKIEYFNSSDIIQRISSIEEGKLTGRPFSNPPLSGLHHIHLSSFTSNGASMYRTIKEFWFYTNKAMIKKEHIPAFNNLVNKYTNFPLAALLNDMHNITFANKKLKGEWLIYKQEITGNYYLCIAAHREADCRATSDQFIYNEKIAPYLKDH